MYLQARQRGVLLEQQLWKLLQLITVQPPAAGKTYDQMAGLSARVPSHSLGIGSVVELAPATGYCVSTALHVK